MTITEKLDEQEYLVTKKEYYWVKLAEAYINEEICKKYGVKKFGDIPEDKKEEAIRMAVDLFRKGVPRALK